MVQVLSRGWGHSVVLVQSILLSVPLSTQVYKGNMGICELHAAEGNRGQGGLPEIDYHPIKGVGGRGGGG